MQQKMPISNAAAGFAEGLIGHEAQGSRNTFARRVRLIAPIPRNSAIGGVIHLEIDQVFSPIIPTFSGSGAANPRHQSSKIQRVRDHLDQRKKISPS